MSERPLGIVSGCGSRVVYAQRQQRTKGTVPSLPLPVCTTTKDQQPRGIVSYRARLHAAFPDIGVAPITRSRFPDSEPGFP